MVDFISYKKHVGDMFLNKDVHLTCDCIIGLDVVGKVVNYEIVGSEIVYVLSTAGGKIIRVGENTPDLKIKVL